MLRLARLVFDSPSTFPASRRRLCFSRWQRALRKKCARLTSSVHIRAWKGFDLVGTVRYITVTKDGLLRPPWRLPPLEWINAVCKARLASGKSGWMHLSRIRLYFSEKELPTFEKNPVSEIDDAARARGFDYATETRRAARGDVSALKQFPYSELGRPVRGGPAREKEIPWQLGIDPVSGMQVVS